MRQLLTERLPNHYGIGKQIHVSDKVYTGQFSLSDASACFDCKQKLADKADCGEQVMRVRTSGQLHVVDFEAYVMQFDNTALEIGERCDYLLYDEDEKGRAIAFCDLTCSAKEHVEPNPSDSYPLGKRFKAFEQMRNSLELLLDVDLLNVHVLTYQQKLALFGWREKENNAQTKDKAEESMEAFGVTPASVAPIIYTDTLVMGYGFVFVQVKYPTVFDWNKRIHTFVSQETAPEQIKANDSENV